jgi:replicative DNA helicase
MSVIDSDGVPDRGSIETHLKIFRELSRKRRIIAACDAAKGRLQDSEADVVINETIADLNAIAGDCGDLQADSAMRASNEAITEWVRANDRNEELLGLPTGIATLDRFTCGIRPGEHWVFGARPGQGKSSLACKIVRANCLAGKTSTFSLSR